MAVPFITLIITLFISFAIVFPRKSEAPGQEPDKLPIYEYVKHYKDEEQYIMFLIGQVEQIQKQIYEMKDENTIRFKRFKWCLRLIVFSVGFSLLAMIVKNITPVWVFLQNLV